MDTILPPAWVVGVVTWGVESAVSMAQRAQPELGGGPRNCIFVPTTVRSQVLQWGHASRLSCHLGATRMAMTLNRDRVQRVTNQRRVPAPAYRLSQRVWLLARDLPLPTISCKLAPRYVGPYTIDKVINPSALRLTLPPLSQDPPSVPRLPGEAGGHQ